MNSALNTGFFFGLESELCVALEFRLVSTCSRFKITLCSSPLKTWLKSAKTIVNLIEPSDPCFNFSLIKAMLPQASPEGTFDQNLFSICTITPKWPAVSKLSFAMYKIFWLQSSITLKNVLNLGKVNSWQNHSSFLVFHLKHPKFEILESHTVRNVLFSISRKVHPNMFKLEAYKISQVGNAEEECVSLTDSSFRDQPSSRSGQDYFFRDLRNTDCTKQTMSIQETHKSMSVLYNPCNFLQKV